MSGVIDLPVFHQGIQNMPDGFGWSQTGGEYLFFIDAHGTIFSDIWNVEAERGAKSLRILAYWRPLAAVKMIPFHEVL